MLLLEKMSQVARRCMDALTFIFGEGSWSLKAHELEVLNAALSILDEKARTLVEKQLDQGYFVERVPDGRINVFRFYDAIHDLRLPSPEFSDLLVSVKFIVDGARETAHVTFYKGQIFSIEFKKPGKFYVGKNIEIGDSEIGESGQSYTHEIDQSEHGELE